jgi:hypothetical protein
MAQDSNEQHPELSLVGRAPSSTKSFLSQILGHDGSSGLRSATAQTNQSMKSIADGSRRTSHSPSQNSDDQSSQDPAVLEQNPDEILRSIKDTLDGNVHLASTPGIRQAITDECSKWNPAICGSADFVAKLRSLEGEELAEHLLEFHYQHDEPSRQSLVVALSVAIRKGSDWQPDRRKEAPRVDANEKIFTRLSKACADRLRLIPEDDRTFKTNWFDWQLYTLQPFVHTLVDVGCEDAEMDEQTLASLTDLLVDNAMQKWYVAPE